MVKKAFALWLMMFASLAFSADRINSTFFGNVAIDGYDPVAYFQQDAAVKGDKSHAYEWQGAKWYFSSAANRDLFAADPEKYAPQYGGYCAYAVAHNTTADIDPSQFAIVDNKLYLNYNADIQQQWQKQRSEFIKKADSNWPAVLD